jgi:hypothetical protein
VAHAQFHAGEDGRPDINVCFKGDSSRDFYVEVKVSKDCPLTRLQSSEEGRGYRRLGKKVVFLIPSGWRHLNQIRVDDSYRSWSGLAHRLRIDDSLMEDAICREYSLLLDSQFPSIHIGLSEVQMLKITDKKAFVSIALRLHGIVDELAASQYRVRTVRLAVKAYATNSDYGFDVKVADRPLLWVGMWSDEELLLGASFKKDWHPGKNFEGFLSAQSNSDWNVLSLNDLLCPDRDVVSEATGRIQTILDAMLPE